MQAGPVIPVIVLHQVTQAVPLAQALLAGGIRVLEVTLRTPAALACIEAIARHVPEAWVGAGTVCSVDEVQACVRAGAQFAVSPGYTPVLGQACHDFRLPLLPGVASASDIMQAQQDGWHALKFFPALAAGGLAMLQAWWAPFAQVQFCPTGGITAANSVEFLALPNVACVGGSWLAPAELLDRRDWAQVTALARQACQLRSPLP